MKVAFEIGNRIEMTHVRSASGRKLSERKLGSQLIDFDGVRTAKISVPIIESRVVPLELGDDYEMCFFTNAGLYQCKARIQKRYSEKKMNVMQVFLLTELKKYQRRKFYRLDCMFSIKYRMLSDEEIALRESLKVDKWETEEKKRQCMATLEGIPKEWKEGTISDLSGGGLRFRGRDDMQREAVAEVMLPLSMKNGIVPLTFFIRVVSCTRFQGSPIDFEVRGEFVHIEDDEREIVVKYVFEEQRRRLRKEW